MKLDRIITKAIGGVAVLVAAWALSPVAIAADTRDYSTYVRLKSDASCAGGYPAEDKWDPVGEMSNEKYYLVPTGRKITSTVNQYQLGGTWPGMELAIQGQLSSQVNDDRGYCATVPHLALLPGGKLSLRYAFGTISGETLDIRGTAENPALIESDYCSTSDKWYYYPKLDIAFTGDADGVVRIRHTGTSENSDLLRAFRVTGGFANFLGTVIVDGARTWLRPETGVTTFDIGGTLWVTNGANIYIDVLSPTFGSLVLASDATLRLNGGKFVTVTNAFSVAEGAKITVDAIATTAYVTDDGSNSPPEIPVLSVCGAANAAAVDRDALLAAIAAGSALFKNSIAGGIPRLVLVESARADGGVDFKVSHAPIVKQIKSCEAGKGPYGDGLYAAYLSDGCAISPEKDYYDPGYNIYFKGNSYEFPGRSLSLAGMVGIYNWSSFTVADLRLLDGAWFRMMKKDCTVYLYGRATLYGTPNFRVNGTGTFIVRSTLAGTGDLIVALDVAKCGGTAGSDYLGNLSLEGDNSAWSGRALVGCGRESTADIGLTNLTLKVASGTALGGAMDAFTFDGVKVADTCTLSITDTATFDAVNRGWCLMDGSTVSVSANKTATMCESVTFGGASVKKGNGTLILGGTAKFYDDENDVATDTPNGASFRIAAGTLGVTSPTALAGVSVAFADGVGIVALQNTSGLVLSSAPTIEGSALPVRIEKEDQAEVGTVSLLTLPTAVAFDTSKLVVAHMPKYRISTIRTRTDGANTVYYVTFSKIGFTVNFR